MVAFTYGLVMAIAGEIPKLDPANQARNLSQDGYVYASDGKTILAVLRGEESRVIVTSDQIAPVVKQAIVAVEDRRYWEHRGVDVRGIARAVWSDIRHKEVVQGGSTITQQFVKNTVTENDRTISRKLKEAALAWQLERRWSKDRILTAYLNTIFFGNGAYGIQMAARVYFDKPARDLTLAENGHGNGKSDQADRTTQATTQLTETTPASPAADPPTEHSDQGQGNDNKDKDKFDNPGNGNGNNGNGNNGNGNNGNGNDNAKGSGKDK
jgi:penicillin-binding protein 1A